MESERYHTKRIGRPHYRALASACYATRGNNEAFESYASVIDLGCSVGELLYQLKDLVGVDHVFGADHSHFAMKNFRFSQQHFKQCDFNTYVGQLTGIGDFDLVMSMECAEHLHNPDGLLRAVDDVSHKYSTFIFSGGHEGQRGKGHVSCKPLTEWRYMIERGNWCYDHVATLLFHRRLEKFTDVVVPDHYRTNTMVFNRYGNMTIS